MKQSGRTLTSAVVAGVAGLAILRIAPVLAPGSVSDDGMYRTSPLKGLFSHEKGGFYHDGRFATLKVVVDRYNDLFKTGLSEEEKSDLIAYLRTL